MFSKLLKHEWKDNAKLLWILTACVVGVAILATVLLRSAFMLPEAVTESDYFVFYLMPIIMALFVAYLSILAYGAAVHYLLLFRFYKSRFTDRGYLMFTLPVKTSHHFTVPALNMVFWFLISGAVTVLSFAMIVLVGLDWQMIVGDEAFYQELVYVIHMLFTDDFTSGYMITLVITTLVQGVANVLIPMSCIVAAAAIAKKHKILVSVGLIYGVSIVMGIISYIITMIPTFMLMAAPATAPDMYMSLTQILSCIVPVGLAIGGYFLSTYLMKHKLNLP